MNDQIYALDEGGQRHGPYDMITIVSRIRAGKITPDTGVYVAGAAQAVPASSIPEIAEFFSAPEQAGGASSSPSIFLLLGNGWRFVGEHIMTAAAAGALTLIGIVFFKTLEQQFGTLVGGMLAAFPLLMLGYLYMIVLLRIYREQALTAEFADQQLLPAMKKLALASLITTPMLAGGYYLYIAPMIVVATLFAFMPFILFDQQSGIVDAMHRSRRLFDIGGTAGMIDVTSIVLLYAVSIWFVFPLPLTMPLLTAALIELYEKLAREELSTGQS